MKSLLLISLLCLLSSVVGAQIDSCAINLKRASADYDQGDYDHAISTLNITIKGCDLSKQEQIHANELLILCYLHIDNLEAANSTADAIMKIDPTYAPDKFKDDPKLVAVFSKFKPVPIFAIGIAGGGNSTMAQVLQTYSVVYDDNAPNLGEYKGRAGFQLSAFVEQRLIQNLWIHGGFAYRSSNYEHRLDSIVGSSVNYSEKLSYFDFPLQLKYAFLNKAVTPFLYAGVQFSFLNSSISTTAHGTLQDLIDRSALRNSFFIGYTGGAGVSYRIDKLNIFLQADYTYVPKQLNKEGSRLDDPINLFKYYYIDDDFRLRHACISVGGTYNLVYRNKKL